MTPQDRREQARRLCARYRRAGRKEKTTILDAFCLATGLKRKYAIGMIRNPPEEKPRRRSERRRRYGERTLQVLAAVWEAADYPWSTRLKAMLPLWLPSLKKRMVISAEVERQLAQISPRTIDRRLRSKRMAARRRLYGRTKPGTLLKHQIPIRTDRWDVNEPGWGEIDLVSHSGSSGEGEFAHTLTFTDIHSAWVETRAVLGKGQHGIVEALSRIALRLPFPVRGLDSDNGSEFINQHVLRFCQGRGIQFTRGRPYKKDDNAHVEQKNWTHVRRLVGWERIDNREAVVRLNDLYENEWCWMMNLFQPSVKLLAKQRVGSKVRRRYDAPATPLERLLRDEKNPTGQLAELSILRRQLDPFALSNRIQSKIDRVHRLARLNVGAPAAAPPTRSAPLPNDRVHPLLVPPPRGGGRPLPEKRNAQS